MDKGEDRGGRGGLGYRGRSRRPYSSYTSRPVRSSYEFSSSSSLSKPSNRDEERTTRSIAKEEEEDSSIVGTCLDMCPAEERAQRERLRDLAVIERLNGNPAKTSPSLAVKKFCRTISTMDSHPSDVRPLQVLEDTLSYLLNLLNSSEHPFEVLHDFIFDRTRSIRQDLVMQNIVNHRVIYMYEEMVKFHITSHHKLSRCSSNSDISPLHHLNMEQLSKCLLSIYELYNANRESGACNVNEAYFRSFYLLLQLGSNSHSTGESLSLWLRRLPTPIIKSKEMNFGRRILRFFRIGNYKQFLSFTATEASFLQYCLLEPSINEVRILAVSCINNGGYKLFPYPLQDLSKLLLMQESDVESFCYSCGLEIITDEAGNKFLPTKQTSFSRPKVGFPYYSLLGSERLTDRGYMRAN
ncbi:hypothetical protein MKW98_027798 [Papaver atlanticum]|uniref:SAC3/GANP/THP3 conserved domain-containing protein n=1 Tax=Papaver atlanticum TaxID=357466 RepID=A0AAD4SLY7_9MAGN|nr:hypothetical protein MKW98_027798 [Papaver atlanticum]